MANYRLTTPLSEADVASLRAGDVVSLSGILYTGRDAAHKRLVAALDAGEDLPFDPRGAVIYYVGPSPARPGRPIGAAGPTTSYRMDSFAPRLIERGLAGMIGKGQRSPEVRQAMTGHGAVYFGATGGAGALLGLRIKEAKVIAYEDLGPEAVRELVVEDFPVLVINDCAGGDLYVRPDVSAALGAPEGGTPR
jgi:fumarate hydratase subunit beta